MKFHVKNILRKMQASNRADASARYLRLTLQRRVAGRDSHPSVGQDHPHGRCAQQRRSACCGHGHHGCRLDRLRHRRDAVRRGASGWSAVPRRTSRSPRPSSTRCASSGPSATTSTTAAHALLSTRGTNTDDVERVAGGKSFFWAGEYGWDLNSRETLDTQLGVFETFQPKLSAASRESRGAVSREHPARAAARRARPVRARAVRRAGLDEPLDRHRAHGARRGDQPRRLPHPQRRRAAPAHGEAEPRRRGP